MVSHSRLRTQDYRTRSQPLLSIPLFKLHGDLPQVDRTKVYFAFCKAERGILFCTDVGAYFALLLLLLLTVLPEGVVSSPFLFAPVARGLDLPAVNWIVQYDPPAESTEYIHRVSSPPPLTGFGTTVSVSSRADSIVLLLARRWAERLGWAILGGLSFSFCPRRSPMRTTCKRSTR